MPKKATKKASVKKLKVYERYVGPKGLTYETEVGCIRCDEVWQVVAQSQKQGDLLIMKRVWRKDGIGVGIVAHNLERSNKEWSLENDGKSWNPPYRHMQPLKE